MSAVNEFPVFTVKQHDGKPCGHQHQTHVAAENCALNLAQKFKGKAQSVLEWKERGTEEYTILAHYEVQLKQAIQQS